MDSASCSARASHAGWNRRDAPSGSSIDGGKSGPMEKRGANSFNPLVENWDDIKTDVLGPIGFPRHPFKMARFGMYALRSTHGLVDHFFKHPRARALFAGVAAHSVLTFDHAVSAAIPLVLTTAAHAVGWPIPAGGAQSITTALIKVLEAHGGSVRCNHRADETFLMARLAESPRALLCDVTPRQLIRLASGRLPAQYRKQLASFRYGPGVYKVDWALNGPIPWTAKECLSAGTVHLGGTLEEIARSEKAAWSRRPSDNPFVLLTQPTLFDPQRAPHGCHTAWAYCHVPNGSSTPMLERIEKQIERFAPGFRERVLARHIATPADLEHENENLIGGDIVGGISNMTQMLFRPTRSLYATPIRNLFLCSSSTPPGGGVHGMCGYHAARMALNF